MVQLLDESKGAGLKTLVLLDEQGEQLDRIEAGADTINTEMREAEKNLQGMEGCCGGLCVMPWQKQEESKEDKATWKKNEDGKLNQNGPKRIVGDAGPAGKGFVNRITNDAREDEMDENLVQVSSMIGNLRNMAIDMGNEIETQNQLIGRVQAKVTIFLFYFTLLPCFAMLLLLLTYSSSFFLLFCFRMLLNLINERLGTQIALLSSLKKMGYYNPEFSNI
jgi:synaptosomal-associated protein 25